MFSDRIFGIKLNEAFTEMAHEADNAFLVDNNWTFEPLAKLWKTAIPTKTKILEM
jgi:hypothetical protein